MSQHHPLPALDLLGQAALQTQLLHLQGFGWGWGAGEQGLRSLNPRFRRCVGAAALGGATAAAASPAGEEGVRAELALIYLNNNL